MKINIEKNSPIQPPLLTPSSSITTTYSLFDSHPFNDYPELFRKHSIQGDGADFLDPNTPSTRRASSPTILSQCAKCLLQYQSILPVASCGQHRICHNCQRSKDCPTCTKTMNTPYNITAKEYVPTFAYVPAVYPCAKVTNIPWDVSQNDVRNFFGNCRLPSSSVYTQSIHILMDRTTGKTLSDAYVEFASVSDLWRAIETRSEKPLKGRIVTVTECSPEELLSVVFPKWRGQFQGNMAIPPTFEVVKTMSTAAGGGAHSACPPFITREEINSLLVVCKNYKLHFSRKCAERPFENIITVITKYPWHQAHLITTIHRDHIYELLKLSIESLKTHLSKDYIQIDPTLLERLVRAGIMCPAFTERQKMTLLQTSRLEKCPVDIVSFMYPMYPFAQSADYYSLPKQQQQQQKQQQRPVMTKRHSDDIFSFHQINVENVLGDDPASISSLIRDIQQQCQVEDRPSKPTENKMVSHGIPLLLHPLESKGSPWTSSSSSTSSLSLSNSKSDIWKASSPVLESNKLTSSKVLAA